MSNLFVMSDYIYGHCNHIKRLEELNICVNLTESGFPNFTFAMVVAS